MTIEEKAKAYDEALEKAKELLGSPRTCFDIEQLKDIFPELRESEDERIRKQLISICDEWLSGGYSARPCLNDVRWLKNLLEKQEQKPEMIQWTGQNLREIIDFTGKSPRFDEWFKSWDEYEAYVHSHDDILKLFGADGSCFEVPVGAWIVKTPDGYNIPSRFVFKQKPAECNECAMFLSGECTNPNGKCKNVKPKQEWSEEDERVRKALVWHLKADADFVSNGVTKAECIAYLDKQKAQRQEWSEEDKRILKGIIGLVDHNQHYNVSNKEMLAWLKSLRPQPKQDVLPSLNEKDIICLKRALDYLRREHNRYGGEDFTNEIVVLEWLITHPILVSDTHWKPSEEQMKALINCIIGDDYDVHTLVRLASDLKTI